KAFVSDAHLIVPDGQSGETVAAITLGGRCTLKSKVGIGDSDGRAGDHRAAGIFHRAKDCSRRKLSKDGESSEQQKTAHNEGTKDDTTLSTPTHGLLQMSATRT